MPLTKTNRAQRAKIAAAARRAIEALDEAKKAMREFDVRIGTRDGEAMLERRKLIEVRIDLIARNSRVMRLPRELNDTDPAEGVA